MYKGKIIESINEIKNCLEIICKYYNSIKLKLEKTFLDDDKYKYILFR